jgi:hypothetical protein
VHRSAEKNETKTAQDAAPASSLDLSLPPITAVRSIKLCSFCTSSESNLQAKAAA